MPLRKQRAEYRYVMVIIKDREFAYTRRARWLVRRALWAASVGKILSFTDEDLLDLAKWAGLSQVMHATKVCPHRRARVAAWLMLYKLTSSHDGMRHPLGLRDGFTPPAPRYDECCERYGW